MTHPLADEAIGFRTEVPEIELALDDAVLVTWANQASNRWRPLWPIFNVLILGEIALICLVRARGWEQFFTFIFVGMIVSFAANFCFLAGPPLNWVVALLGLRHSAFTAMIFSGVVVAGMWITFWMFFDSPVLNFEGASPRPID